jgi:hypothetical protein
VGDPAEGLLCRDGGPAGGQVDGREVRIMAGYLRLRPRAERNRDGVP